MHSPEKWDRFWHISLAVFYFLESNDVKNINTSCKYGFKIIKNNSQLSKFCQTHKCSILDRLLAMKLNCNHFKEELLKPPYTTKNKYGSTQDDNKIFKI